MDFARPSTVWGGLTRTLARRRIVTKGGVPVPVTVTAECFDPAVIMESGQCFRMVALSADTVEAVACGRRVSVTALGGGRFAFDCDPTTFETFWRGYFALDTDYAAILAAAPPEDAFLSRALQTARGLRILRQDPWETLCAFILSQRKHLKAIRLCMETLCARYGEPVEGTARSAFPTPARLAALPEAALRECGLGYRAPYVLDAAQKVALGQLNLRALAALPDAALRAVLQTVHGVGVKVADCVMLFAYARLACAPVDVWIHRVIDEEYAGVSPFAAYGGYAGVYQQYLFMLRRDEGRSAAAPSGNGAPANAAKKQARPKPPAAP